MNRNAELKKEKDEVLCNLRNESALSNTQASRILMHHQNEDHETDLCNAESQSIYFCQKVS